MDTPNSRNDRILLAFTILVAAALRMGWPGVTEFKADEARLYSLALDMAEGLYLPMHGISSSLGFPNFPISAWIYAIPTFLWKHPYSATLCTGLLGTLSVLGCWWLVQRYWGTQAARAATLIYALSPWAVIYSRKIWAQNLLPLFVLVWAASGILTFVEGRRRAVAIHVVCLAIVLQIHLSAVVLVPLTVLGLILYRTHVDWRWLTSGVALSMIIGTPLAIHLFGEGSDALVDISTKLASHPTFSFDALFFTWMLSSGQAIHSLAGASTFRDYLATVPDFSWVQGMWGALIASGCWYLAAGNQEKIPAGDPRRHSRAAGIMIIIWLLAPGLFHLWPRTPIFPHYLIITFPAQYIAAGVGAAMLIDRASHGALKIAGWGLVMLGCGLQVWALAALLNFVSHHDTPGGFGEPLSLKLAAVDKASAMVESGLAKEVLLVGSGEDPAVHEFPAVYGSLLRSVPHRFVNGSTSALWPLTPTAVLLQPGQLTARHTYSIWATNSEKLRLRRGSGELTLLYLPERTEDLSPREPFIPPRQLANGVTLLGYTPLLGESVGWEIYWQTGEYTTDDYHFFNHLLDNHTRRIGQADTSSFAASQWRQGDQLINFFYTDLVPSTQPTTLRVGMYTYPEIDNVPLVDSFNNPISDWVTVKWYTSEAVSSKSDW